MRAVLKAVTVTVTAMTLVAMCGTAWAQKGKPAPAPNNSGEVTFAGGPSDEIVSDGFGAYGGAIIYGSGVLYLDLGAINRSLVITLRNKVSGETDLDGEYRSDGVLRIDNIYAPDNGSGWGRATGRVSFGTSLTNHALGFRYATSNGVPVYGTNVCVRRIAPRSSFTWEIASSEVCAPEENGHAGLFEEGLKGKGYLSKGVYPVKFRGTVTCTTTDTCPQ